MKMIQELNIITIKAFTVGQKNGECKGKNIERIVEMEIRCVGMFELRTERKE